jgi:hypothetical protein
VETPDGNWLENAELEYGEVPRIPGKKKPGANKSMREAKKKKRKKRKYKKLLASSRLRRSLEQKPHITLKKGLSPNGTTIPNDGLQIGSPGLET